MQCRSSLEQVKDWSTQETEQQSPEGVLRGKFIRHHLSADVSDYYSLGHSQVGRPSHGVLDCARSLLTVLY